MLLSYKGLIMQKQPLGKTLLRNVIRHTDAHNKIQEEIEMWKMRDWEVQMSHHKDMSSCMRGYMHCDRQPDQPRDPNRRCVSDHDDREARYWTRKLYDFEDNDPDRWGHSGFKELYPEEFESDSETDSAAKKMRKDTMKKSKSGTKTSSSRRSKKSSRKKKKKKKKKKEEEEKQRNAKCSGSDDSPTKEKQQRKRTKNRHKNKRSVKSSSGDSDRDDKERHRRTHRRKRPKQDPDSEEGLKQKRRKNWRAAGEDSSDGSSGE